MSHPFPPRGTCCNIVSKHNSDIHSNMLNTQRPFMCHSCTLFLSLALLIRTASAHEFHSRDAHVSAVIAQCEAEIHLPFPTGDTLCQATLGCILRSVGAYTAARWSAGASILAFIPTRKTLPLPTSLDRRPKTNGNVGVKVMKCFSVGEVS